MAAPESRKSEEGLSRLIAFADAVVAIALTLLVLPLVDIANDLPEETSTGEVVSDHSLELTSFFVSFVVIWILWRQHHQTMEYFRAYDRVLVNLTFVWLLTIVVLPFATAMVDDSRVEWATVLYIGVLAISVAALVGIGQWGHRHRDLLVDDEATDRWTRSSGGWGTLLALAIALAIALVYPKSGNWPLLLLVLTDPIERLLSRVRNPD
ncbi:TMEM175 family protein [Gordonia amicalis]|uniref:TMEM175 family protein n=1 Tax=Gordonia amicalis TaxID=89053 RepID=UPI0022B3AC94|nr:TMEM175 family protein [Gordonia amicalis]MCZ4580076.1 TMEM175 family protein [Gordonia amicalis]